MQPLVPRRITPVVVHPQEAALQQIGAQPFDLRVGELRSAPILDADIWTLIEVWIGESNHEVVRLTGGILAHAHLRQLGKPFREVALRVGIVCRPSLSARFTAVARVHHTGVVEAVAERVRVGEAWTHSEESAEASTKLRPRGAGDAKEYDEGDEGRYESDAGRCEVELSRCDGCNRCNGCNGCERCRRLHRTHR